MNQQKQRSRLHLDIRRDLVRAAKAKAGFDGIELNAVVAGALEKYLAEELAILQQRDAVIASTAFASSLATQVSPEVEQ